MSKDDDLKLATDYREISTFNEEMLGKDRASRMSQVSMYADTAHFVYEILQNADDACASEVVFKVFNDKLIIEHDGNPFTRDDVKAVSYFGKGKTDITKIGHFGLGFKSVFAYTASPSIHSGTESFVITDLYTLAASPMPADLKPNRTRFVLPFDHEICKPAYIESDRLKSCIAARKEIAAKLEKIGSETLLFTRNLTEIRWEADERPGHYLRDERSLPEGGREIFIVTAEGAESCYLVFEEQVARVEGESSQVGRLVQVAYKLTKRMSDGGTISPIVGAKLFVFFQTEKETHTGLIFQAPYRTTPARDNIPEDDEFNRRLVKQSAHLLIESIQKIKQLKLLSLDALSTLPLDSDRFVEDSFFYPLHVAVRGALQNLPLLPTSTNGYVAACQAKLTRVEMTKVFDNEQLETLFGIKGVRWLNPLLTGARYPALYHLVVGKRRSPSAYFQKAEWASEPLAADIEVNYDSMVPLLTSDFFEAQSDQWLIRFMTYVSKGDIYAFHDIPIVRLEDGRHVTPFDKKGEPNAYLPPKVDSVEINVLPMVKVSLLSDTTILEFLEYELNLERPDLADFALKDILPRYRKLETKHNVASWKNDFRIVVSGLTTDSFEKRARLMSAIKTTPIFMGVLASNLNELQLVKPHKLYISSAEVDDYFLGNDEFLITPADCYESTDFDALVTMGVARLPRVFRKAKENRGYVHLLSSHGWHKRGLDGFDPNWVIEGLTHALQRPTVARSKLIWKLLLADFSCIRGIVEMSTQQSYGNSRREESISKTGNLLIETAWLASADDEFFKPCDISLEQLPSGFETTSTDARSLADRLGMKKSDEQDAIATLSRGDPMKRMVAEFIMNASGDAVNQLVKLISKQKIPVEVKSFKEGVQSFHRTAVDSVTEKGSGSDGPWAATNPERYLKAAEDDVRETVKIHLTKSNLATFSLVRDSTSNKPARDFLEQEYQGRCQVTGQTFRKRTGGNYFEALVLVDRLDVEPLNNPGNMLCLCADVAAQFKFAEFSWIDSVEDKINAFKAEKNGGTEVMRQICVLVDGKRLTITWSERHFLRLCALWNAT